MVIAVVTAIASLIVSIITGLFAYATRVRGDKRLAELQSKLSEERDSRNAQRDYEYDARRRLYAELQPVLFQLADRSARALERIQMSIVRGSRDGSILWPGRLGGGWREDPYHMTATVWDLVAPLALFRVLQQKLTSVDLSVDSTIRWQYVLARGLYNSWTAGNALAWEHPGIDYNDEERQTRQHLLSGPLEQRSYAGALVRNRDSSGHAPITYSKFQASFCDEGEFEYLFSSFSIPLTDSHPSSKRVLWRILLVQAHILAALIKTFDSFLGYERQVVHPVDAISEDELQVYNWRSVGDEQNAMVVDMTHSSVRTYLRTHFSPPSSTPPQGVWSHFKRGLGNCAATGIDQLVTLVKTPAQTDPVPPGTTQRPSPPTLPTTGETCGNSRSTRGSRRRRG